MGGAFSNSSEISGKGVPMSKRKWKTVIKKQMDALGIEVDPYGPIIDTLADILEQRDRTYEEFQDAGGMSVVEYTNKAGATNATKNPLLVLWDELNKNALAYWKELGLTPSGYKKVTGDKPQKEKQLSGLAAALASIES